MTDLGIRAVAEVVAAVGTFTCCIRNLPDEQARARCAAEVVHPVAEVGAEEGRLLNRDYRGKDYATNVLTFDYARAPRVVADIVLCAPVVEREAGEQGIALEAHYAHLLVHGALHAQGFDHEHAADAKAMEARESEIVVALGFADPYAGSTS